MNLQEFVAKSFPYDLLQKDWTKRKLFLRFGPQELLDKIHEFEVREDDIWIVTLSKCGTTWMQELVWLLVNNCDFEMAKSQPLELRSRYLEFAAFLGKDYDKTLKELGDLKDPRVLKTHLPLPLLPKQLWFKKPKLIYVYRNPKDAMVSAFHHRQNVGSCIDKSLVDFIEHDLIEELRTNNQWNHVLEFYELRNESWIHYTSFERMKKDLRFELNKVCEFLKIQITVENVEKMLKHLSFEEMKNNPQCNHPYEAEVIRKLKGPNYTYKDVKFIRKGKVDSHKEELPPELIAKLDEWIDESLKPHNLKLDDLLLL